MSAVLLPPQPVAGNAWRELWLITIGHGLTHWYPATFYLLLPLIGAELGLSYSQIGLIMTCKYIASAIANVPGGVLVDTVGRKGLLMALSLFWIGFPYLLIGFTHSYLMLLACVALVGVGNSLWHPTAIPTLGRRYPERKGLVLSVHGMGGNVGDAVAPLIIGAALAYFSWREVVVLNVVPGLVVAALLFAFLGTMRLGARKTDHEQQSFRDYLGGLKQIFRSRSLILLSTGSAFRTMTQAALLTFLPVYLAHDMGYSPFWVGACLFALQAAGFAASPLAGHLSDRMGRKQILVSSMLATAVVLAAMAFTGGSPLFIALVAVLGFFLYATRPVIQAWMLDSTPKNMAGSSIGVLIVVPDKMSQEKIFHLKAMGAEVVLTRSDVTKGHPEYYQDMAARLATEQGAFYVNQFANPANPLAHEQTTGPEIWEQMEHKVDAVVAGVGTGGTITGLSRYFARVSPQTEMVVADPVGSIVAEFVRTRTVAKNVGSWLVEGIGEDFIPPVCDLSRVKKAYSIPDAEAFNVCRDLLRQEGIFAGSSSGTLIGAALRYCREQKSEKRVVSLVCDSGNKYLSKVYNDYWMIDQGFIQRDKHGDLRDLIARRHKEHAVATVAADEAVLAAYQRMKLYDVSQLPVLKDGRIVGIVDEEDILREVAENPGHFREPVTAAMEKHLVTVPPGASVEQLNEIFKRGLVAIVVDGDEFLGLITRIDLLNWLRRRTQQ